VSSPGRTGEPLSPPLRLVQSRGFPSVAGAAGRTGVGEVRALRAPVVVLGCGQSTPTDDLEAVSLFWPSYFADPAAAPPMPPVECSQPAYRGLWADLQARLPGLASSPPFITVPFGVIVGELSPMPATAGTQSGRPHSWRPVARRAGSGPLRLARGAGLPPRCDGSARRGRSMGIRDTNPPTKAATRTASTIEAGQRARRA
jgi:hypothetical protein